MMLARILLLVALGSIVQAQTTYTGCHNHSTVEYVSLEHRSAAADEDS